MDFKKALTLFSQWRLSDQNKSPYTVRSQERIIHNFGVYTNKSICMAKRGHGSPQARFAIDCQIDMIAEDLGIEKWWEKPQIVARAEEQGLL